MQGFGEWLTTLDWGDVPSWVGGLGTTAAVGFALWQSARETRKQRAERERAQAETVAAWIAPRSRESDLEGARPGRLVVYVQNGSAIPIHDLVVTMVPVRGAAHKRGEELPSGSRSVRFFLTMPPGTYWAEFKRPYSDEGVEFGVEVAFRDAAGRSWARRGNGALESLRGKNPRDGHLIDYFAKSNEFFEVAQR